jgi:hypothetical protein
MYMQMDFSVSNAQGFLFILYFSLLSSPEGNGRVQLPLGNYPCLDN